MVWYTSNKTASIPVCSIKINLDADSVYCDPIHWMQNAVKTCKDMGWFGWNSPRVPPVWSSHFLSPGTTTVRWSPKPSNEEACDMQIPLALKTHDYIMKCHLWLCDNYQRAIFANAWIRFKISDQAGGLLQAGRACPRNVGTFPTI